MITAKDLRRNCIYKTILKREPEKFTIFKFYDFIELLDKTTDYERVSGSCISNMNGGNYFNDVSGGCFIGEDRYTIEASDEERLWLQECIKQGKFINKEDILFLIKIDLREIDKILIEFDELL